MLRLVGLFYIAYRGRIRLDIFRIVPGRFLEIEGCFVRRIGLFISAILLVAVGIAFAQQTQDKPKERQAAEPAPAPIPAADAAKKNPVKPTRRVWRRLESFTAITARCATGKTATAKEIWPSR